MSEEANVSMSAPAPAPTPTQPSNSAPSAPSVSPAPSSTSTNTNTSPVPQSPAESRTDAPAPKPSGVEAGGMRLVKDKFGKPRIEFVKENASEPSQAVEHNEFPPQADIVGQPRLTETAMDNAQVPVNQPPQYNLQEFSMAIASGNIDESRVPQEFKQQYENFRINQAVQAYNENMQRQAAAQEQARQQVEKQLTPEEEAYNRQVFYSELDKEANERAIKEAGLTPEDVENLAYLDDDDPKLVNYRNAKEWHKNNIMLSLQNRAREEEFQRQQQQAVYQDIQNFVANAKATEPNFQAIDVIMSNRYKTLPYEAALQYSEAINALKSGNISPAQARTLQQYYEKCRVEYYAQRNGLSTTPQKVSKPPVVERAGDGREVDTSYSPDFNKLRSADVRGRREWVAEYLRNRNR